MIRGPGPVTRWLRFNLVGVAGFAVQLATLAVLTHVTPWPLGVCVALAVLAAIAHNFFWHERYTWPSTSGAVRRLDDPADGRAAACAHRRARAKRCLAFTLTNGAMSLLSNVVITTAVATLFARLPLLLANAIAVALTSLVNFLIADRAIFHSAPDQVR